MTRIYLSPPDVGDYERQLLLEAFDSKWIAPLGPHVDTFEAELAEYVGVEDAAALSSGTAGLHLGLRMLGVGTGDEVFTSSLTFVATASAITYVGAQPVFIDVDPKTWQLDPALLAETLANRAHAGRLPSAVITVDLYGQCADADAIGEICALYAIPVIEDAAEALGAWYKNRRAGALGRIGVFSFNGNKIISTSGGGMLVSDDGGLIQRARYLATQARDPQPHYQHSEIGYNYRMSNLLAAVGRAQLAGLDDKVAARRRVNARYRAGLERLPGVEFMPHADYGRSNCWLTCITVDARAFGATNDEIRNALEVADIEARPVWKPMHLQPVFAGCEVIGGDVAAGLFADGLCLPSGSNLGPADQDRVVAIIQSCRQ